MISWPVWQGRAFPRRLPSPRVQEALTLHTCTTLFPPVTDPAQSTSPQHPLRVGLSSPSSCRTCAVAGATPGDAHGKPLVRAEVPGSASAPALQTRCEFSGGSSAGSSRTPHRSCKPFRARSAGGGRSGGTGGAGEAVAAGGAGRQRAWGVAWSRRRREAAQSLLPAEGGLPRGAGAQPSPARSAPHRSRRRRRRPARAAG